MYENLVTPSQTELEDIWIYRYYEDGSIKSITPNPYGLAQLVLQHVQVVTFTDTDESYFWHPEEQIWVNSTSHLVREVGESYWSTYSTRHYIRETLEHVQARTFVDRSSIPKLPPEFIPLNNGIYDINNGALIPHTPEYFYTTKLPVDYDPQADCPQIKRFFSTITDEPQKLQELVGYCLYRAHPIHKAFILEGGGGNGKSTFLGLLDAFLGEDNTTSVTLHELCNTPFASARLYGKLANLVYELPSTSIWHTEIFKAVTGNDKITAQEKHKPLFEFRNYSKQIFACNKIPISAKDDSDAFYRRFIIIEFPYIFDEDTADKWIDVKIQQPNELSGLFNHAVEGLKRLLENGKFTETESIEDARDRYKRKASPVYGFIMDHVKTGVHCVIRKDDLYELVSNYCFDNGYKVPSKSEVGKELSRELPYVRGTRMKINTRQEQVWVGITVPGYDPFESEEDYVEGESGEGQGMDWDWEDYVDEERADEEPDEEYWDLSGY